MKGHIAESRAARSELNFRFCKDISAVLCYADREQGGGAAVMDLAAAAACPVWGRRDLADALSAASAVSPGAARYSAGREGSVRGVRS